MQLSQQHKLNDLRFALTSSTSSAEGALVYHADASLPALSHQKKLTVWSSCVTVMQHMATWPRCADWGVRRVSASTIQVGVVKEGALETILHHPWVALLHDLYSMPLHISLQRMSDQ